MLGLAGVISIPGMPMDLNALVLRLLEKDPADRFASAHEVGVALERINMKHFGGHSGPSSDRKMQSPFVAPLARPVAAPPSLPTTPSSATPSPMTPPPTDDDESNPFEFRSRRNKLVSLSSGEMTTPFPSESPTPQPEPARSI